MVPSCDRPAVVRDGSAIVRDRKASFRDLGLDARWRPYLQDHEVRRRNDR
jgi:hypothetical protein